MRARSFVQFPIRWISVGNHAIRLLLSGGCKTELMTLQAREIALHQPPRENVHAQPRAPEETGSAVRPCDSVPGQHHQPRHQNERAWVVVRRTRYVVSSACRSTFPRACVSMPNATIARVNASPTSAAPHHFGNAEVSFARPAPTGETHEKRNRIGTTKATGRIKGSPSYQYSTR